MSASEGRALPPDKARVYHTAVRIEWLTIAYMASAVGLLYLTLGNSQAMKAAWWEDLLGLLPPLAFLLSDRFRDRDPTPPLPLRLPPGDLAGLPERQPGPVHPRRLHPVRLGVQAGPL